MSKLNKKGFTLVELLAVIVILAVVMLIAVTAVGPLMSRARKSSLATEGLALVNAAKAAFASEQLSGIVKPNAPVCFQMKWLCMHNYFEKGCDGGSAGDKYAGSVLIVPNGTDIKYYFWIGNAQFVMGKTGKTENLADVINPDDLSGIDPNNYEVEMVKERGDGAAGNGYCGLQDEANTKKLKGVVFCDWNKGCIEAR